ncbi:MAG: alpha/beta fold hydrolase [Thermoanaerobaculia bacterium]
MPQRAEILGTGLEVRWIGPPPDQAPTIVFLHEGLGSARMWRDFPDRLSSATGCGALVYSRLGYGGSDPVHGPRSLRFMHDEALHVLPAIVERFQIEDLILFGHSDGASIAIIYAGSGRRPLRALVLEAPHVFIEPICIESIRSIANEYETTPLRDRLARYHGANTESMFKSWTDVWLSPEFPAWNIEEYLPVIASPVLVVQGEADQYGTLKQVDAVLTQVAGPVQSLVLPDCGHSPHSQHPGEGLDAASRFLRQTLDAG